MKILSLVPSYSYSNFTEVTLTELAKYSDIVLFSTYVYKGNVKLHNIVYDLNIGRNLTYEPRKYIHQYINEDWDYVLYNEDDILIPEKSFQEVLKLYNSLPDSLIPGFVRYEIDSNNVKRYFDLNSLNSVHTGGNTIVKKVWKVENELFIEPWNLHSGNFLFSKKDITNLMSQNLFEKEFLQFGIRYGNCDQLESAASTPYLFYNKVYPLDLSKVECYHLTNKYINFHIQPTIEDVHKEIINGA